MAITEQNRRDIFNCLEDAIGGEQANHLMELLPTTPAAELVTRSDMATFGTALRSELRGEMAELRAELRGEMAELRAELRGEMAELRAELRGEMAELRGEMAKLRGEIDTKLANAHAATQRLIVASMIGNAIAVVTALTI